MTESELQTHPGSDDLLRLLDGEMDPPERQRLDLHLRACAECRREMEAIRRRWARLDQLLRATDVQPDASLLPPAPRPAHRPSARSGPGAMRWAAAVAGVLLAGALAGPLRAVVVEWVGRRWTQVSAAFGGAAETPPTPQNAPVAASPPGSGVRLLPAAGEFVLRFDARQAGGTLSVERGEGPHVAVDAVGGGSAAPLLVLPGAVRVRNAPQAMTSYRLTVPATLAQVRIRIGSGADVVLSGGMLGSGGTATLDLTAGNRE